MDGTDEQPPSGQWQYPSFECLIGEGRHIGTYTPPAPYRVFKLITGGAASLKPTQSGHPDLTTGSQKGDSEKKPKPPSSASAHLRLV